MARKYDIVDRLASRNVRPFIVVTKNLSVEVNTSKTTALHFMAVEKDDDLNPVEKMDKMMTIALGEKAFNEIEKLELSFEAYELVFEAISAALSGEDLEETQERFQEEENTK